MRVTSLGGHSFWSIIYAQALLCAFYIHRSTKLIRCQRPHLTTAMVLGALAAFSSIGWYAGQLMPDIFTGIGLLAIFQLFTAQASRVMRTIDALVVIACCWVHLSNMLILPLSGISLLLLHQPAWEAKRRRPWIVLFGLTVISWGGLAVANRMVDKEFYISRGGHVFLVAHMVDTGMLRAWLAEHCTDDELRLCAYKDRLPMDSGHFLWTDSISPMHLEGGWLATRKEYDHIISSTLTEPRYLAWHIRSSITSTMEQLTRWSICVGLQNKDYRTPTSPPYVMIAGTLPSELPAYLNSMQNGGRGELSMRWPDRVYALFTLASVLGAISVCVRKPSLAMEGFSTRTILLFPLGAVLIGCWVCSTLAVVDDRYLARISWIIPLFLALIIAHGFAFGRKGQPTSRH